MALPSCAAARTPSVPVVEREARVSAQEGLDDRIDVNAASAGTLAEALSGIGAVKAAAIVAHRETHGPFASVDALVEVRGIGPKTLERLRPSLTVGASFERRGRAAERRTREALARVVAGVRDAAAARASTARTRRAPARVPGP